MAEAAHAGRTVQRHLHDVLGVSHQTARGLIDAGAVRCNGTRVTRPDHRLVPGDRLEADWDPSRRYRAAPAPTAGPGFRVLHEDDTLAVVEKEAGVLTVPAPGHPGPSLAERLEEGWRRRGFKKARAHVVHRIDLYTSGLVVFARTRAAWEDLKAQFASGSPERIYLAVAEGRVEADSGRLVHHLTEHPKSFKVQPTLPTDRGARRAASRFRVLERFAEAATLVEVSLETGRRNQIRVQFAATGHPLVGDVAYGHPSPLIGRTALHAARLRFRHPVDGSSVDFRSEIPADLRRLLRRLRAGHTPRMSKEGI
ncbi:MAG TPA: RluA family pseudouridine synthase [Candidatus Polarisedimenticolaceae bacterium]|nr:RluA family pseudouridine synthase [Candidatus Polarisedimenticolaceae bacterium]